MKCLAFSNERENANVIIKFECKLVVCMSVHQYVCLSQSVWGEICICIFIHIFFLIARAKLRSVETNTNGQRNCNLRVAIYNHIWIDEGGGIFVGGTRPIHLSHSSVTDVYATLDLNEYTNRQQQTNERTECFSQRRLYFLVAIFAKAFN